MNSILVGKIECLIATWQRGGLPGRNELHETGNHLLEWRRRHHIPGLWQNPPLLVGATLDDAWGVGLELILKYAQILGMQTRLLGLLLPWREVLSACIAHPPDFLGLTVLHFDTEDDLLPLRQALPGHTRIIAGGPVFRYDPELQERIPIDFICADLTEFLELILRLACDGHGN